MNYVSQETDRLIFRALTLKDINGWLEFFQDNDRLIYLGLDLSKDFKSIATEWINRQLERYKQDGFGHLAAIEKTTGEFIGMGGILKREINGNTEFEIAYSIKPKFWNKGYATEIARQMKSFGRMNRIADQFISIIDKNNLASIAVAKKNGMEVISEMEFQGMQVCVYGEKPIRNW